MKRMVIAALVAGQIFAAAPAAAADLDGRGAFVDNQRGAFVGVRLRARAGGPDSGMRASLTLAPTVHSRTGATTRMAMNEGLDLGISPGQRPTVMLAGQQLNRMTLFGPSPQDDRSNLSTLATVAIVAGVVVLVGAVAWGHVMSEASCIHGGDDSDC